MTDICPACEKGRLVASTCDEAIRYEGIELMVRGYEISVCQDCGEEVVLSAQAKRNAVRVADAKHARDETWSTSEIQSWRARWSLTQQAASDLLGGGPNAFSKYERGEVMQSKSMDLLMRASDVIAELRVFLSARSGVAFNSAAEAGYILERDWKFDRLVESVSQDAISYACLGNPITISIDAGNDSAWHNDDDNHEARLEYA